MSLTMRVTDKTGVIGTIVAGWIFGRKRCAGNVLCRGDHGSCRIMGSDPSSQSTFPARGSEASITNG